MTHGRALSGKPLYIARCFSIRLNNSTHIMDVRNISTPQVCVWYLSVCFPMPTGKTIHYLKHTQTSSWNRNSCFRSIMQMTSAIHDIMDSSPGPIMRESMTFITYCCHGYLSWIQLYPVFLYETAFIIISLLPWRIQFSFDGNVYSFIMQ